MWTGLGWKVVYVEWKLNGMLLMYNGCTCSAAVMHQWITNTQNRKIRIEILFIVCDCTLPLYYVHIHDKASRHMWLSIHFARCQLSLVLFPLLCVTCRWLRSASNLLTHYLSSCRFVQWKLYTLRQTNDCLFNIAMGYKHNHTLYLAPAYFSFDTYSNTCYCITPINYHSVCIIDVV